MPKLSSRLILGLPVLSAVGLYSLFIASPASAFVMNGGNITVGADDLNKSFDILFDGNVSEQNASGLSSKATFTFLGFSTIGKNTEAAFKVLLSNTSSSGISSRSSALGFDVDRDLVGTGDSGGSGNTRVSGLFSNDRAGSFPNKFGAIDVCFTNGNTCQGGKGEGNGSGVMTGNTGEFLPILALSGKVSTVTLSNFGVRYQSINGNSFNGASGTGHGSFMPPVVVPPVVVELPPAPPVVMAPVVVEPIPIPPVVVPPVVVEPIPVPPVVVPPVVVPPVVVEPIPVPPVVVPPVVVEPIPVPPVVVPPVVVEPTPVPPVVPPVAVEPTPTPSTSEPVAVPEPGMLGGLLITGLVAFCRGKKR